MSRKRQNWATQHKAQMNKLELRSQLVRTWEKLLLEYFENDMRTLSSAQTLMAIPFTRTEGQLVFRCCLAVVELEDLTSWDKLKFGDKGLHFYWMLLQYDARDDTGLSLATRKDATRFLDGLCQFYSRTIFDQCPRNYDPDLLIKLISHFSCRNKNEHDMVNSSFSKLQLPPKSRSTFRIWPTGTISPDSRSMSSSCVVFMSMRLQNVECVSRYTASCHLQKFAANSNLSTSQNFSVLQNFHSIAKQQSISWSNCTLDSSFIRHFFKTSFVQPSKKIVRHKFWWKNRYIT